MYWSLRKSISKGRDWEGREGAWKGMERLRMDVRGQGEGRGQVGKRRKKGAREGRDGDRKEKKGQEREEKGKRGPRRPR